MKGLYRTLRTVILGLAFLELAVPAFGQTSTVANSVWNGGTGPWTLDSGNWVTNGTLGSATPNNGDMVICNVDESCTGYFNVTIGSGGNDLVTLDSIPVTIDSLTLGASTGSAALYIGSSVADTLTIGDPTAPNGGAAASLTVNSTGELNVFAGSKLDLNIAAGNGTVTNNGTINLEAASGTGSSLLINDAGNAHQLTLSGSGTLNLQAGSVIQGVTGGEVLINSSTIQGSGTISNLALTNNRAIIANGTLNINTVATGSNTGFTNSGVIDDTGGTLKATLTNGASGTGLANSGTIAVTIGGTFFVGLAHTVTGTGFSNSGTVNVNDGGTLEFQNLNHGTTATINNFQGNIHLGGARATLLLNDSDNAATFNLIATKGSSAGGTVTLVNSSIKGVSGDETLVNGAGNTIQGSGKISNLALVNKGTITANGTNPLDVIPNSSGFTNDGTVNIEGSTLAVTGSVTNAGTIQTVKGDPASKFTVSGTFTNDVNGTLILANSGDSAIFGKLVNGGTIDAVKGAFVGIGDPSFTLTSGCQQLAGATMDELISSPTDFGIMKTSGPAAPGGTLEVTLENGFIPAVGDQFAFMDFTPGDLKGAFSNFAGQTFDNGLEKWGISYNNAGGDILLTAEANTTSRTPEPGSLLLLGTGLVGLGLWLRRRPGLGVRD
jgi:hypothetical protein